MLQNIQETLFLNRTELSVPLKNLKVIANEQKKIHMSNVLDIRSQELSGKGMFLPAGKRVVAYTANTFTPFLPSLFNA